MAQYDLKKVPPTTTEQHKEIGLAFCKKLFGNPDVAKKLIDSKVIAKFIYWDEDLWGPGETVELTVDCSKGEIVVMTEHNDLPADLVIEESRATGHIYWMGKLNFMTAVTRGLIKVKGSIRVAMKLVPVLKPGFVYYRETLEELGYDDLLAFPPD